MLLTSPLSSPLKNPLRDGFSSTGGSSITAQVQALFAGGKVGGMWDLGDMSALFQDNAGATPVTAVTQPIGRVNDKSGLGNHATQSTAGARPLYQVDGGFGCAQFDGGKWMTCGNIDMSSTDKATVVIAMTIPSMGDYGIFELGSGTGALNIGQFNASASIRGSLTGSMGTAQNIITAGSYPATPYTKVLTISYDMAGATGADEIAPMRLNGVDMPITPLVGPAGTGNLQNGEVRIGLTQGTFLFTGDIHRIAMIGGALTGAQTKTLEMWAAEGNGQTVP